MAALPVVSIIIAARNEGDNVRRTVDSILANTSTISFEIVLIDDGNTDESFVFLDQKGYRDDVRLRRFGFDRPVGCIRTRHQGARLARGQYILFLDAHMAVKPGWLEGLVQSIERSGTCAAVTPNVSNLEEATWTIQAPYNYYLKINETFQFKWEQTIHPGYLLPTAGGACVLMPRALYWEVGGFDLGLRSWGCEFVDLILKIYAAGGACYFEPSVQVGHLFRSSFPYEMSWVDLTYNTLRVGYVHLTDRCFRNFVNRVAEMPGFDEAQLLFRENLEEISFIRRRQERARKRDAEWFVRTFLPALLDEVPAVEPARAARQGRRGSDTGVLPLSEPSHGIDDRVSLIMAVRNEGQFVRRTVDSLLLNTEYPNFELIVLDDASEDGCCAFLLEERFARDSRVRLISHEVQRGYVLLLNEGARIATGTVLKFLDAHHCFSPNWLGNLYESLKARGFKAIVGPLVTALEPTSWLPVGNASYGFGTDVQLMDFWHLGPESVDRDRRVPLLARYQIMLSRQLFDDIGRFFTLYRGHGYEDFDLCLRAASLGYDSYVEPRVRIGHLPKKDFVNPVSWGDLIHNKLMLAYLNLGVEACDILKSRLVGHPGAGEGIEMFEKSLVAAERARGRTLAPSSQSRDVLETYLSSAGQMAAG